MSPTREPPAPDPRAAPQRSSAPIRRPSLEPEDRCVRCGRPTPAGVSLCPADNPGGIGAPSATQVHGTILLGVIAGFIVIALAARLAVAQAGPFVATVAGTATRADGGIEVRVRVENQGQNEGSATCRVSLGDAGSRDDVAEVTFVTQHIAAGGSQETTQTVPASAVPPGGQDRADVTIRCT
jgi:hypothetical protein